MQSGIWDVEVTIGVRMGSIKAGLFCKHLEYLCLYGNWCSRVNEIEEAIEIIDPIIKVI